ncbi:hypothetical protein [Roseibium sp.]|uniref:hypothetical protein n=1 Tax=Roseibium sp. TaxID=1936156 RepID=UPI003B51BD26
MTGRFPSSLLQQCLFVTSGMTAGSCPAGLGPNSGSGRALLTTTGQSPAPALSAQDHHPPP